MLSSRSFAAMFVLFLLGCGEEVPEKSPTDHLKELRETRLRLLEAEFGPSDANIIRSRQPVFLGGTPDVVPFDEYCEGVAYVTAGMIGSGSQREATFGQFEIMMCSLERNSWLPNLLAGIGAASTMKVMDHGTTLDLSGRWPEDSTISSVLFERVAEFRIRDTDAGVLLAIGITADEQKFAESNGSDVLVSLLQKKGVYPYTDANRESVVPADVGSDSPDTAAE